MIRDRLVGMQERYPDLLRDPVYLGVIGMPQMKPPGNRLEMCTVCVGYDCFEEKSGSLGLHIRRELVELVNTLQYDEKDGLKNNDCIYSGDSESDS